MDLHYLILFFAISFSVLSLQCNAGDIPNLYRWVDEKGHIYYSDKVPPKHSKFGRSKLNDQGVTVSVVEAAKTREQLNREAKLQSLRSEQIRLLKEHQAKDQVLLRTFQSEAEIERTLQAKLSTIQVLESVTFSNIKRLETLLKSQEKQAADMERNGKIVPERIVKEIRGSRNQLEDNRNKIKNLNGHKLELRKKYAEDLARFRTLVTASEGTLIKLADENKTIIAEVEDENAIIISVAYCPDQQVCDKAWKLAKTYVIKNATTPLRINTGVIIYSAPPVEESDIALSVSRIGLSESESAQLFLDARCKQSGVGQELCSGKKVREILAGFPRFINSSIKK